jgi:hypothetical protein
VPRLLGKGTAVTDGDDDETSKPGNIINLDAFRTHGLHAVPNLIVWVSNDADDVSMHENVEEHLTGAQAAAIANKLLALASERK